VVAGDWQPGDEMNATEIAQASGDSRTDSQTLHQSSGWQDLPESYLDPARNGGGTSGR